MLGNVFKAYDVRGKHPDPLNEKLAWQIGYGASQFLRQEAAEGGDATPMMQNIVVGRDMRTSSPALSEALINGVTDAGGNVIDVGLVDTPFIYFAVNRVNCAGGIMTTASHNPPEYNGFKICRRRASPVGGGSGLDEIRKQAAMADPAKHADPEHKGRVEQRDLWDAYIEHVHSFLDLGGREIRIVVDASNGMAGPMISKVFGRRGEKVEGLSITGINLEANGEFAHPPDPLVRANLRSLQEKVVETGADLGMCFDGDGDRCVLVDERGQPVGCDHLTAWLARMFLAESPGSAIVYDLRSSKAVQEEVEDAGGRPVRSRVGHVFLKSALAEHDAIFGGELSGHFYFQRNFNADSGAIAMATALTALSKESQPLSAIIAPIARYPQSGEINFRVEDKDAALENLAETFFDEGEIDHLDGVTIDCFESNGWWCNVRKSNTEPLLRLNLEARDGETLGKALDRITPLLGERVEH